MPFDFSDFYDGWETETLRFPEDTVPNKSHWAVSLLEAQGFTIITHPLPKGQINIDALHEGSTIHFWDCSDARGFIHELAHSVVWVGHGRPGGPQQWGIGSRSYHPRTDALEQLVFIVEWVLANRKGQAVEGAEALTDALGDTYDSPTLLSPNVVLEAIRLVDLVLPDDT